MGGKLGGSGCGCANGGAIGMEEDSSPGSGPNLMALERVILVVVGSRPRSCPASDVLGLNLVRDGGYVCDRYVFGCACVFGNERVARSRSSSGSGVGSEPRRSRGEASCGGGCCWCWCRSLRRQGKMLDAKLEVRLESVGTKSAPPDAASASYLMSSGSG